jgi:hypothetical protein
MIRRLRCLAGRHVRSRSAIRQDGDIFQSVCRTCGQPMTGSGLDRDEDWRVDSIAPR